MEIENHEPKRFGGVRVPHRWLSLHNYTLSWNDVSSLFFIALDAFFPPCHFTIRDAISCCPAHEDNGLNAENNIRRILGSESTDQHDVCTYPLIATDYQAGCDEHKYQRVHVTHNVLFWITIAILFTFEVEFSLLIYLLGPTKFFHQVMYMVDLIIVSTSLALELTFHLRSNNDVDILPGILIIFRLWRFVRIGHGLVESTYEMHLSKMHLALDYIDLLEEILKGCGGELPERPKQLKSELRSE